MILQAVHDTTAARLDTFAKSLCILLAGFPGRTSVWIAPRLATQSLFEFVVTGVGNILLVIQQAIHGSLLISLRLAAIFLGIGPARTITLLRQAGKRKQAKQQRRN
jgi:predicted Kef-type K+ transport protein